MIRLKWSSIAWVGLYVFVVIVPLVGGAIHLEHGRGFWLNFSIALGFLSLSMLGAQFVIASRMEFVSSPIGMDVVLAFHRAMAYPATAFALVHPLLLFALDVRYLQLLNVFSSPLRAKFAVLSAVALVALVLLSIFRRRWRIRYKVWQISHWLLALTVLMAAMAHVLLVNYYLKDPWQRLTWQMLTLLFVGLGLWVRVLKPLLRYRRRWRVAQITAHADGTVSLELELVNKASYGPKGFAFKAGQFAWITARNSPFSFSYNPFSISSSALVTDRIGFTIKGHEGFSAEVAHLQLGDVLYVDGPYGGFFLDEEQCAPLVLIGAGVGVTPLVSMLETLADQRSARPCHLWLASKNEDSIVCQAQIERLQKRLSLEVLHVFSSPLHTANRQGARLDPAFILRHLPAQAHAASYFVCGPMALMEMAQQSLLQAGVPAHHIHHERFGIV